MRVRALLFAPLFFSLSLSIPELPAKSKPKSVNAEQKDFRKLVEIPRRGEDRLRTIRAMSQ